MKILILCADGSNYICRMAHGFLQSIDDNLIVRSAYMQPVGELNAVEAEAMSESGINIPGNTSGPVEIYLDEDWDYVITVCCKADTVFPAFTGKVKDHLRFYFSDPPHSEGNPEFIRSEFCRVNAEICCRFYDFYVDNILYRRIHGCSDGVVICHCGGITLGDIRAALKENHKTIAEIRSFLGKGRTGFCSRTSPNKRCCHKRFQEVINRSSIKGYFILS